MSLKKKLFKETIVYGVSRYASFAAAIFLTPIYTRLLSKTDYGVMDVFNKWNTFALSIIPLGLMSALVRFYPDIRDDAIKRKQYLGSILSSLLIICLLYIGLMIIIEPFFVDIFISDSFENLHSIYQFSWAIVSCQILFLLFLEILRVNHRSVIYASLSLLNFAVLTFFGFYFVYFGGENIVGFFKASFMASFLSLLAAIVAVRKSIYLSFNLSAVRKMLRYSLHLLSTFILFQITDMLDRYLIKEYYSLDDVGLYSIGSRVSSVLLILISSMSLAWMPRAFEISEEEDANSIYGRMFNGYMSVGFFIVSMIIIFRKEIIHFFAPGYQAASDVVVLLLVFNLIMGLVYVLTLGIHLTKKTSFISISAFIAIVVKIVCNMLLVERFGIAGIAWASVIESIIWISLQHYFSQKLRYIPFNYYMLILIPLLIPILLLSNYIEPFQYGIIMKIGLTLLIGLLSLLSFKKLAYQ